LTRKRNAGFVGLFLTADLTTRLSRIARRKHDAWDATRDVALKQEAAAIGAIDWHMDQLRMLLMEAMGRGNSRIRRG
jgi:uncharacterized protein